MTVRLRLVKDDGHIVQVKLYMFGYRNPLFQRHKFPKLVGSTVFFNNVKKLQLWYCKASLASGTFRRTNTLQSKQYKQDK